MKGSNGFYGSTETAAAIGQQSDRSLPRSQRNDQPSLTGNGSETAGFALSGRSELPDPAHYAYRKDLADIALAGQVIASHYAEPLPRQLACNAVLLDAPAEDASVLARLEAGDMLHMLDNSLGWAWGYAGRDRLVGYVRSDALSA